MTPSEKVASRYADLFVELFDSIESDPGRPLVISGQFPQQNVDGVPFNGSNAMLASLVASQRGYNMPVWLTMKRKDELGLKVNAGEHSIPIVHYDVYYEDVNTKKRDPAMNDTLYATLTDDEKKNWVKRCYMNCYPEFNIAQTNFAEIYPEQMKELTSVFGEPVQTHAENPILDSTIKDNNKWLCPIIETDGTDFTYNEAYDEINVPSKAVYNNENRYYGDFLYILARSTGSEGRMDRDINSGDLSHAAHEELISELASATLSTLAGVQSCIQEHNLANLKSWVNAIKADPTVIYKAVNDAAKASDLVSTTLGLELRKGFNVQKVMDGVEEAQNARKTAQRKREQRTSKSNKKHHKNWKPIKAGTNKPKIL